MIPGGVDPFDCNIVLRLCRAVNGFDHLVESIDNSFRMNGSAQGRMLPTSAIKGKAEQITHSEPCICKNGC